MKQTFLFLFVLLACFSCKDNIVIPDYIAPEIPDNGDGNQPGNASSVLKYQPEKYYMWDNWTIIKNDSIHLFHIQGLKDLNYNKDQNLRGYGHAVSTDFVRWTEEREVLSLYSKTYPNDVDFRYSGCTAEHNGKYYMYYTMRKWAMERIGLAISDDLYNWTIYDGNPVLEPDGRWFITFNNEGTGSNNPTWGYKVDCRDMLVIKDPNGAGYYGYFVSSVVRSDLKSPTSAIGVAYSTDMIHWQQKGVAYRPMGVGVAEMVDVFQYQGKWYMTLTTCKDAGMISTYSDPYIFRAQLYAVADSPEGPFIENPVDNVILGGSVNSGYSMRSVEYKGKRRVMYVDADYAKRSVLSLPKDVGLNEKGQLRLFYASDLLQPLRVKKTELSIVTQPNTSFGWPTYGGTWKLTGGVLTCETDVNSWQGVILDGLSRNMEFNFTVSRADCQSYGIMLTTFAANPTYLDNLKYLLVIDYQNDRLFLTNRQWIFENVRKFDFEDGRAYQFKMLLAGNTIELYIDNELVFNSSINNAENFRPGLFVNDGDIEIKDVEIQKLQE
ncbi:hypothetical protein FACS189413_18540 [Bacteroidia bacterium]|nr:hypothetical protein FACS189413_18540 [Bacteroidia bacterium]